MEITVLSDMWNILEYGNYAFAVFLFIGVLWKESDKDIVKGTIAQKLFSHKNIFLVCGLLAEILIFGIACVIQLVKAECLYGGIVIRVLWAIIAYIGMPSAIGFGIGQLCGKIKNNFVAVVSAMVIGCFFYYNIPLYIVSFVGTDIEFNAWISKLFMILPDYYYTDLTQNPYNPFSVTISHWQILIFWLVLEAALWLLFKKKWKKGIPVLFASGVILIFTIMPQNEYLILHWDNALVQKNDGSEEYTPQQINNLPVNYSLYKDKYYYAEEGIPTVEEIAKMSKETKNFEVKKYDLHITAGRITKMIVNMELVHTGLDEYAFTLYHGYEVKRVTDGKGNELEYSVLSDYITVYNTENELEVICMEYEGAAPVFMAETSYTYLPEYYRYYPLPGVREVFIREGDYYYENPSNYYKSGTDKVSEFHVKVDAAYEIYSNLEKIGRNEFQGNATGCTLLGGICVGETQVELARVIYPKLLITEEEAQRRYKWLVDLYAKHDVDISGRDWIVAHYNPWSYTNYYCGADYFTGSYTEVGCVMTIHYGFQNWKVE